jgi:hypothetical protein
MSQREQELEALLRRCRTMLASMKAKENENLISSIDALIEPNEWDEVFEHSAKKS